MGRPGYCRAGGEAQVFSFGAHHGEEPPVSGTRGSGAVFFSRCTLRCVYCQNFPWSQMGRGETYTVDELARMFRRLRDDDACHNWNLVSPTPWLPMILPALELAARAGGKLPVVYNTSGFDRVETIRALAGVVDVYLADLRYAEQSSATAGSDAPEYVAAARAAFLEMWRQAGPLRLDRNGLALAGVICRLLVLPGLAGEACANLRWLADNVGAGVAVSVMAQYVPAYRAPELAPWNRRITVPEYEMVCRQAEDLGFAHGWIQDYDTYSKQELLGFAMRPRNKTG